MTESNPAERRQHLRVPADFSLHMGDALPDGGPAASESINISSGGLYCRMARPLELFTRVSLTLVFPASAAAPAPAPVEARAVVVRCDPSNRPGKGTFYDVAVCFTDVSDSGQDIIDGFIASRAAH